MAILSGSHKFLRARSNRAPGEARESARLQSAATHWAQSIRSDASFLTFGGQAPDAALTLNRVALGIFFAISGYHKLFNAPKHETLIRTLQDDGTPAVPIMQWLVPGVEFGAGCALVIGLLSALAELALIVLSFGAVVLNGMKRIRAWQPTNRPRLARRCALPTRSALLHRTSRRDAGGARTVEP